MDDGRSKKRDRGPFRIGEKVLVPHTDKYYEAKVVKSEKREGNAWFFLLHYSGWGKRYDEWVAQSGLVKYDADVAAEGGKPGSEGGPPGKKRRGSGGDANQEPPSTPEEEEKPVEMQLPLPAALLRQLVEEWERVTKQGLLPALPRRPCVDELLDQYKEQTARSPADAGSATPEEEELLISGLRTYFNRSCRLLLLYPQERQQAEAALGGGEAPSSVFGGEHLLRMFVRLPQLLPMAMLPPTAAEVLEAHLKQFIAWMASHQKELFLSSSGYRPVVQQHAGALAAVHSGAAMGAPAGPEVAAAFLPPDRPGHASGADMNGNGSDMVA